MPAVLTLVAPDSGTLVASCCVVNSPYTQAISNEAVERSPFVRTSLRSLFFARMVRGDVVYTDVAGNASPSLVDERDRFGGGSVIVWGGIAHGLKSKLIVVEGNMTAVRYRDEVLRPVVWLTCSNAS